MQLMEFAVIGSSFGKLVKFETESRGPSPEPEPQAES
jgi:hypothetical protein